MTLIPPNVKVHLALGAPGGVASKRFEPARVLGGSRDFAQGVRL